MAIVERLRKIDSPAAREAAFVSGLTDRAIKVDLPDRIVSRRTVRAGAGDHHGRLRVREEAADELVGLLRELVDDAIAAGATYVQFDVSGYMMLSASPLGAS